MDYSDQDYYTVAPADTLIIVAAKTDTNYKDLARINDITNHYSIKPGQKLRLRD